MDRKRRKALEADGWKVGTVQEALGLSDEEMALVDMKFSLSEAVKAVRARRKVTQAQLAKLMDTGQSRIAALENGDASIEAMIRALLLLGSTRRQIANKLAGNSKRKPVKAA
jgi:DNA-binding transcriptional regulator YiaG